MELRSGLKGIGVVLAATFLLCAQEQSPPAKDTRGNESQGLPSRTPADYAAQAKAGDITIAAEFDGHNVPTEEQTLTTEDYIVVEAALFGPSGAHLQISRDDFSLRVNGKKQPAPSVSYVVVFSSLKDPTWVSPDEQKQKESKTSFGSGGNQDSGNLPKIIHVPIELQRAMQQHTQKAALPLGDRPLPQAGLLFFPYRGKEKGINSLELIYSGAAGKATVVLQR